MGVNLTIIGLGQIGSSIGLALQKPKAEIDINRVGLDKDIAAARRAKDLGVIDRVELKYSSAVKDANVVILAVPFDQIYDTLEEIAPTLSKNTVVIDTAPIKKTVLSWAEELLLPGSFYVGLIPAINPIYLHDEKTGLDAARPDLFKNGIMGIVTLPTTHPDAIKLASDLTNIIGSRPLFLDPDEIDGLMAATHIVPQLLAATLAITTIGKAGWRDNSKLAGRAYALEARLTELMDTPECLAQAALNNRENTIRILQNTVGNIQTLITDLESNNKTSLTERLSRAQTDYKQWWQERKTGDWLSQEGIPKVEYPTPKSIFGSLFKRKHPHKPE